MSRSRKHSPVSANACARSEKWDKQHANRRLRQVNRVLIKKEVEPLKELEEVSDVWTFNKDGRTWYTRDVLSRYPEIVRK
jgi:hypothetical protein